MCGGWARSTEGITSKRLRHQIRCARIAVSSCCACCRCRCGCCARFSACTDAQTEHTHHKNQLRRARVEYINGR